jgi:tRNA A-37 threonylcarbamoyl transferase component Bud32
MLKKMIIPPSFSLVKTGKVHLLAEEKYTNLLLRLGIEDVENFIKRYQGTNHYFTGRTPHPSIPLENGNRMVLRQYSHGGLLRSIMRNLYLFGSRSFQELSLTEEIRSCGISTIKPIGAIHRSIFPIFYKAYFLSLELPRAIDLTNFLQEIGSHPSYENLILKRKIIRSAGHLLRQFHQAGFFHGDLQLKNFLVVGEQIFVIDFDRSYRKSVLSIQERMKNLLRLNRSVEKWRRFGLPITRTDRWRFFSAYAEGDVGVQKAMKKALRNYPLRSFFYRLGWTFERVLGA